MDIRPECIQCDPCIDGQRDRKPLFPAGEQGFELHFEPVGEGGCRLVGISEVYADRVLKDEFLSAITWVEWKSVYPDTKYATDRHYHLKLFYYE